MNLEWVKEIPNYIGYFNKDHRLIIDLIGIDNYLKLHEYFGKTGIYFSSTNSDRLTLIEMIGEDNYQKLYGQFCKSGIYFGSSVITKLKKIYAISHKNIAYNEAARKLDVSIKTIYNWRQEKINDKVLQNS